MLDSDLLVSLGVALALVFGSSFVSVWLYGRFAKRARGLPSSALPVAGPPTATDRCVAPLTEARPGETGVMVLADNREAFAARALSARAAGRSIDMMYYLWRGDLTGNLLARELLAAADRGARVRLLLDDINTRGLDPDYLALSGHPRIEVRLFNPAKNRGASLRRGAEMLLRMVTVTRRMHNKAWIVDGRLAIVGGRNIGDTYFDAAEDFNSADMDAVLLGPAVEEVSEIFDTYWNSPLTLPIRSLLRDVEANLRGLRRRLGELERDPLAETYLENAVRHPRLSGFLGSARPIHWTAGARVVSDPPGKTQRLDQPEWLIHTLGTAIGQASRDLRVTTAYFVPGEAGVHALSALAKQGIRVAILTNSLASTNQVSVHGGYSVARAPLLRAGVRLFELRPLDPDRVRSSLYRSARASLHTKNFTVDGEAGFIGSFNFDLRSAYLNTEMGLLFADRAIAAELDREFARQTAGDKSFEVYLDGSATRWHEEGRVLTEEPLASRTRRLIAGIVRHLPIKSQL
ncbi:phospholipase D family protein [Amaricoccus solimangrovi]|uniref:Phospholipase D n=1 Tax=Amaricoccus solimangrovi TaxID=2589815 RepID=A0A501WN32_9RHOB|nr:phospholipase D family protein [Amaricoccus solimangrovi]